MGGEQPSGDLRSTFEERREVYTALCDEARFALERGLVRAGIELNHMTYRVKSADSFMRKAGLEEHSADPLASVWDIVGLRVVCLFRSQLTQIIQVIRDEFDVKETHDWDAERHASQFGYASTHVYAGFRSMWQGPRYEGLHDLVFEIQVRTIGMHAWASFSRHVDYKADLAIPSQLRRNFYALSGLFYVADTMFEQLLQGSERSRADVERAVQRDGWSFEMEVNLDSLTAYLRSRFPTRELGDPATISRLVTELANHGYRRVSEVEALVQRAAPAFAAGERDHPPEGRGSGLYTAAGVVRISLSLVGAAHRQRRPSTTE